MKSLLLAAAFRATKNLIRPADSHSSWSMTDKEINPSPEGADLNLQRFKSARLRIYSFKVLPIEDFKRTFCAD